MPVAIQYLISLSLSLAILFLFYQLLLRRLTFYHHNRFFLLGYSLLSFLIPIINISPILNEHAVGRNNWLQSLPTVQSMAGNVNDIVLSESGGENYWVWLKFVVLAGVMIFSLRLIIQLISFRRIVNRSRLLTNERIKLYQIDQDIIPFSFGQSIYISNRLQNEDELKEIIRHEFVHVKQLHTIDIIWAEILCILNWYNPFAWLIRKAIRQNLEFIADNKVVQSGVDKKQYQYLLLKVLGNTHFAVSTQFNFSSLKKRIAMMNKIKTSKVQLLRLLLLLPAIAILLLAFRQNKLTKAQTNLVGIPVITSDPMQELPVGDDTTKKLNSKGYHIIVRDIAGNCEVVIRDKNNKLIKTLLLTEWNEDKANYEKTYGKIPPPPPPAAPTALVEVRELKAPVVPPAPVNGIVEQPIPVQVELNALVEVPVASVVEVAIPPNPPTPPNVKSITGSPTPASPSNVVVEERIPAPPTPGKPADLPANVRRIQVDNNKAEVELKNGKLEKYDLSKPSEKAAFEKKYGKVPEAPTPPPVPASIAPAANSKGYTMIIQNAQKDFLVVIFNEQKREIRKIMLAEWNRDQGYYQKTYGELPPIPSASPKPMIARPETPFFSFPEKKNEGC